MDSKPWYASRTMWLNIASFGVLALNHYFGFADFTASPWVAELFGSLVTLGNLYLRTQTSQPIGG